MEQHQYSWRQIARFKGFVLKVAIAKLHLNNRLFFASMGLKGAHDFVNQEDHVVLYMYDVKLVRKSNIICGICKSQMRSIKFGRDV